MNARHNILVMPSPNSVKAIVCRRASRDMVPLALGAVASLFVFSDTPVIAQQRAPVYGQCANPSTPPDARIFACSAIIQSGRDGGRNLAVSYFNRGAAWLKKQGLDRAIADFDRAISVWPDYPIAYGARASAYLGKIDFDRALSDANDAIRLDPNLAPPYGIRAAVYTERCYLDRAMSEVERSIALNSQLAASYNVRGIIYLRRGVTDRAIDNFDHALRLDPQHAPALVNLGLTYVRKGELDRAIVQFDEAIRIAPKRWTGYLGRGNTYGKKKELDRALADFDMAIRLDPMRAAAYHSRGYVWLQKQELDRAIDDFSKAIRLDARYPAPLTGRGLAYERKGDRDQAFKDFKAALALPLKCGSEKWAHDTATTRLAALSVPATGSTRVLTTGSLSNTQPNLPRPGRNDAPAPIPSQTAPLAQLTSAPPGPLNEVLAEGVGPLTLPGANGDITLDRCYRGPDHLMCAVTALATEARGVSLSYKEIADPKYSDVSNIEAICRIQPGVLADHLKKAKSFDTRWDVLSTEYGKLADCSGLVEESIRNVVLPDMRRGGYIVKSMIDKMRGAVRQVSNTQKEVSALADEIDASKKALTTFQGIRASMCPKRPELN